MDTHFASLTLEFLGVFNAIDKHLDTLLGEDVFLPFNDKIKRLSEGKTSISWFIKRHHYQLRYLGELRNHITHGIREGGKSYAYPSQYAIEQLQRLRDAIVHPPLAIDVFAKKVFVCQQRDLLVDVLQEMHEHEYTHVPVYDTGKFIGILTEHSVLAWLSDQMQDSSMLGDKKIIVGDVDLAHSSSDYLFVSGHKNVYEIDQVFALRKKENNRLGVVLVSDTGGSDGKLLGIVTTGDLPSLELGL